MEDRLVTLAAPNCRFTARRATARAARLTGIDFVDYVREPSPRLVVHLFGPVPRDLCAESFLIEGGRRIRDVKVERVIDVETTTEIADARVTLGLNREGDFSSYVLRIIGPDGDTFEGFDPYYSSVGFGFKLDCPGQGDCAEDGACSPDPTDGEQPVLDYLAKDYTSFRRLLLDRLTLTLPQWRETHVPDVGVALVELMAYVGDQLSYQQDAVATEAYLHTARLRTSVRRHARLVDYRMHEGCNARAWVTLCSDRDLKWPTADVSFLTRVTGLPEGLVNDDALRSSNAPYEVFLPLTTEPYVQVRAALGRIRIYTWGGEECCLPRGATRATLIIEDEPSPEDTPEQNTPFQGTVLQHALKDVYQEPPPSSSHEEPPPPLSPGDVIVFEEVLGPATGLPEHADPNHRHAVRLTAVERVRDPLARNNGCDEQTLYEVSWTQEDALPFPLCVSSLDPRQGCAPLHDVSVARGNVILVDHGRHHEADLGCVEEDPVEVVCEKPGRPAPKSAALKPFRPELPLGPVTHRTPIGERTVFDDRGQAQLQALPACLSLQQDPREAVPDVALRSAACRTKDDALSCPRCGGDPCAGKHASSAAPTRCAACGVSLSPLDWSPRFDLLASNADDPHFVLETDDRGRARLRFGDDVNGRRPDAGMRFSARYRVGVGAAGNVPAEAIAHVLVRGEASGTTVRVRNPLPARGGTEPEPVDEVRELAPFALRARRERAIIADDYAELAMREHPELQRAVGALQWTGSWYEALVGIDLLGSAEVPKGLLFGVEASLERYRRIGHDLRVKPARAVPLYVALRVCAEPHYLREHVRASIREALVPSSDKGRGLFHPDRLTFGHSVVLSELIATVQAVPGVSEVRVTHFERWFEGDTGALDAGELRVGALEIPRLDDDPSQVEGGVLKIDVRGGR